MLSRTLVQLVRLESTLVSALAVFVALFVRTNNFAQSLGRAIPLLFISVCTYIANDLNDIERDRHNHPERPLPAGRISPTIATILYFGSLLLALFSTRYYVMPQIAFWYYALMILAISYGYLVEWLPGFKALYVALAITLPVLIVVALYPDETRLYFVAGSVFLHMLGREICKDILDRPGDATSFMHRIRPRPLAVFAFSLQTLALGLLATQSRTLGELVALAGISFLIGISALEWFNLANYRRAIILSKFQLLIGLYFLM